MPQSSDASAVHEPDEAPREADCDQPGGTSTALVDPSSEQVPSSTSQQPHANEQSATPVDSPGAKLPSKPKYHVEMMREGFWDGLYRTRCGFRVVGLYKTSQEAWDSACLDFAACQHRIRPAAATEMQCLDR